MRYLLLITMLLFFSLNYQAQVNLSIGRVMPKAEFGKVFKPTTLIEVGYFITDEDERFRAGVSIGFMKLSATRDTFNTWGYVSSSSFTGVTSGYEVYSNYYSIPISFKFDYRIYDKKLSPVVGIDIYAFLNSYEYRSVTDRIIDESSTEANTHLGYQIRAGANYKINDNLNLDLGLGRTATLEQGDGTFKFWKTFLAFNYNF